MLGAGPETGTSVLGGLVHTGLTEDVSTTAGLARAKALPWRAPVESAPKVLPNGSFEATFQDVLDSVHGLCRDELSALVTNQRRGRLAARAGSPRPGGKYQGQAEEKADDAQRQPEELPGHEGAGYEPGTLADPDQPHQPQDGPQADPDHRPLPGEGDGLPKRCQKDRCDGSAGLLLLAPRRGVVLAAGSCGASIQPVTGPTCRSWAEESRHA